MVVFFPSGVVSTSPLKFEIQFSPGTRNPVVFDADLREHRQDQLFGQQDQARSDL